MSILLTLALLVVGCGYDTHTPCEVELSQRVPNLSLPYITDFESLGTPLPEGTIIKGRVTANDESENFYHCLIVEQGGAAVELRLALYDLYALYPVGCEVLVDIGGLSMSRYDGVLQLGYESYEWGAERVEAVAVRDDILRRVQLASMVEIPKPRLVSVGEMEAEMCGLLVAVENLTYTGDTDQWAVSRYSTVVDHSFIDPEGNEIVVRTSTYANFAEERVPEERVELRGILYMEVVGQQERFILKLRGRDDIIR